MKPLSFDSMDAGPASNSAMIMSGIIDLTSDYTFTSFILEDNYEPKFDRI